ncbi:hypothetical protein I9W82_000317 [Candida metapsilosis]|uniref:Uncharacterized protein n=1 Tax=Candida metapsilosis TaxID=273372 RepID=A0A8H7ZFU0_9ASCO|nr:hypothetical protein I9W82_000317 [Candida metapsilosis]
MGETKTSRQSLYNDDSESEVESDGVGYIAPNLEFEFVEVEETSQPQEDHKAQEDEEEQEFAFPLFASASKPKQDAEPTGDNERGRSKTIQKISLREHSEERIDNSRPDSYYFASYTEDERTQFAQVAVSGSDIYAQFFIQPSSYKLMDLNEYNEKIDMETNNAKARKRRNRPGKKKRQSRIVCRERRLERAAIAKKEEKERKLKEKQEKFGKFKKQGGGRHTKKTFNKGGPSRGKTGGGVAKPKYRTE